MLYRVKTKRSVILSAFFFVAAFFLCENVISASEGTVELESLTDKNYKCFAASLRMQNLEYKIPFSCHNLIYPADENVFNYVMWATPKDGGKTIKLGAIGLGKGEFKTKTPFSVLFVTTESKKDTKTPSNKVVMRGNVQPIEFLQGEATPTPTPSPESEDATAEEITTEEEVPQQELSTKDKLVLALKRAGIAALFALVALIGIIYVVSRSRG